MLEKIWHNLKEKKKTIVMIVMFCVIFSLFVDVGQLLAADESVASTVGNLALGGVGAAVAMVLGVIALLITTVTGLITTLLIGILVGVAQFNHIIDVPAVTNGWVIIRDLANMGFILILLTIAFATILRVESYSAKKMLPKLLIMAILINFSKTIFGLIIDFSQVIMLTFVSSFKDGAGYFIQLFQIDQLLAIKTDSSSNFAVTAWTTSAAIIAAVIASIMALITIAVLLGVLVIRVVMLWIYTILSPFVFLGFAFPPIQKYTGQIWEDFIKQAIVGPVLAFFIWLALTTAKTSSDLLGQNTLIASDGELCVGIGNFFCQGNFQTFLIVIALLIGGLMVTQQIGGAAGSIAGQGMQWARRTPGLLGRGAAGVGGWGARKVKASEGKTFGIKFGGLELNPMNMYRGIKEGFEEKKRKEISDGASKSADALREGGGVGLIKGLGASKDMTEAYARGWFGTKGIKMGYQTLRAPARRESLKEIEDKKTPHKDEINAIKEKMNPHKEAINLHDANKTELTNLQVKYNKGTATPGEKLRINDLKAEINKGAGNIKDHENEINKYENKIIMEENQIAVIDQEIEKHKDEKPIRTPFTFDANMGRKASVREAMSKIGDNDNAEDLVDMWRHAKAVGDKELAAAVYLAAAKNGHSNEIVQSEKDENGNTYNTNQEGLNAFTDEQLIKKLGMAEQEAYDYQSQFSSICKQVGHFNFSESIGSKNGKLIQKSTKDQERDARAEARKLDPERFTRDKNRFGYGYEDKNKKFRFNRIGLVTVLENASIIEKEIARSRFNKNAAMKMLDDTETLEKYIIETGQTHYSDVDPKSGTTTQKSFVDLIEKIKAYGKAAKDSGTDEYLAAADKVL